MEKKTDEKMEKKMEKRQERAWSIHLFLALHQRKCWLLCAAMAVIGALLILHFCPQETAVYFTIALGVGLMLLYQWMGRGPYRIIQMCMERAVDPSSARNMLIFVLLIEKRLPALKKKEMAYGLAWRKGLLLLRSGQREAALETLEGFDRFWDSAQKENMARLIQKIRQDPTFDGWERKEED